MGDRDYALQFGSRKLKKKELKLDRANFSVIAK